MALELAPALAEAGPPDSLRARLEARRRARLGGAPEAPVGGPPDHLAQRLEQLRQGVQLAELRVHAALPFGSSVPTAAADVLPPAPESPLPTQEPRAIGAPFAPEYVAAGERARRAGVVRTVTPGAAPASLVERSVGRALARLPGPVGRYGERLASLGEAHGGEEAIGRENAPLLARLPADIANLWLELEAGGRIPGPVGRAIGPSARPRVGSTLEEIVTGQPVRSLGIMPTAERLATSTGREALRFGTLGATEAAVEQRPPEEIAVTGLEQAAGGAAFGAGAQLVREGIARGVARALRSRLGVTEPAPPEAPPSAGALPPPTPAPPPAPRQPSVAAAAARVVQPANIPAFEAELSRGTYTSRELKTLRARIVASSLRSPSQHDDAMRVIDAIDKHLAKKGEAGAAPVEREPAPAQAAAPGEALHDVEGRPIPGTEVTREAQAGAVEREAIRNRRMVEGAPPEGVVERRQPPAPPAPAEPRVRMARIVPTRGGVAAVPIEESPALPPTPPGDAYAPKESAQHIPTVRAVQYAKDALGEPELRRQSAAIAANLPEKHRGRAVEFAARDLIERQQTGAMMVPRDAGKPRAEPRHYASVAAGEKPGVHEAHTRRVTRALKLGIPDAITEAAGEMASRVPPDALLVPIPDSKGETSANFALADAIAKLVRGADVSDVLERTGPAVSQRRQRLKGLPAPAATSQAASMRSVGRLAPERPVVLVDNITVSGATAEGARQVLQRPDAKLVTYAEGALPLAERESARTVGQPEAPAAAPAPTVQRTIEEANKPASPEDLGKLADAAQRLLEYERTPTGAPFPRDPKAVRAWAEKVLGRPYSSGTWTTDDAYDAIEVAANRHAAQVLGPQKNVQPSTITGRLKLAREIEEKMLGTRTRTEAMVARQQFSTPLPIAEAAAYATDVVPGEKVLEPTAGTGNLVNPLRESGVTIDANEVDPRRAALLKQLPGLNVTTEDALRLQLSGKRYNAIVMNPPFGGYNLTKYSGRGATEFAASDVSQRFVAAALRSLAENGRLVAVMPEGMMGKAASAFRAWLRANYQVTALIEAPPGSYATRGTTFGTWLLVVDNTGPHVGQTLEIRQPTWEQWYDAVKELGHGGARARPGGHEPAMDVAAARGTGQRQVGAPAPAAPPVPAATPEAPLAPAPLSTPSSPVAEAAKEMAAAVKQAVKDAVEEVRREQPAAREPVAPVEPARGVGGGAPEAPARGVGGERGAESGRPPSEPRRRPEPGAAGGAGVVAPEAPGEPRAPEPGPAQGVVPRLARRRVEPGRLDSPERRAELQAANNSPVFAPYERGTTVERNPHPRLVVETRSQAGMPPPPLAVTDFQSALVQKAWGRPGAKGGISDDQADMALRVLSAWDRGHGFVIADDVGVGKTREAAVLILEAMARGDERILYSTFNAVNLTDVQKELRLVATGSEEGEFPATFILGQDYPKAATRGQRKRTEALPQPAGPTIYLVHAYNLDALSESIGEVRPTVWIADEAHQYKNAYAARGVAWQHLHVEMLERKGKFAYLTATPGVTLDELGYLYGLREWAPGGFGDWLRRRMGKADESSNDATVREAEAAQRAEERETGERTGVASATPGDLVPGKKKPFFREQVDVFSGRISPAETEQVMRELKGMGKFLARDLWRGGVEFTVETVDLLGDTPDAQAARERYNNAAELCREITKAARKYGRMNKQVKGSGLERSMIQSYMKQLLFDLRLPQILREADASIKAGRQVVVSVHSVTGDVNAEEGLTEDVTEVPLNKRLESAVNAINTREVTKEGSGDDVEYVDLGEIPEALAKRAELFDRLRALPPLTDPVRALEEHFGAKKLAVITGQVTAVNRTKQMAEFQAGNRPVALISRAGKTGISLHDVNGKQRHLIVGDYEWSADTFKQELGRVDRAGQRSKPKITLVASNIGGERKFAATIAARMSTLGATSKGAAEATGTDALDQFEATGDLPVAAMKNAIERLPDDLRQYFTGSKFVEYKQGYRGESFPVPKRRPDDADMRSFLLEMLMFPVEEAHRVMEAWTLEREKLMTGEAIAAAEARRTGKLSGRVLRVTELTKAPQPTVTMYEVENDAHEHRAILQGFVTQHIDKIQGARGTDERGYQRPRRYVQFTDHTSGELISGLEVASAEARRIKTAFGMAGRHLTPAEAFSDLQAGDDVKIDGPEGADWVLHPRKDGRVAIRGATLSKHRDVLRGYAQYEAVGNYLYVKDGETAEGIARFLERFPIRQPEGAKGAAPTPEPSAARYERLGRIFNSPLGLKARELIRDRLIEAGHDRAEVEALDDRSLANRALEGEVLTPEEESKLLDGIWGEAGFVRLSKRGRARMAAEPELPGRSVRDALKRLFTPAGRTEASAEAAGVVRARAGEFAREVEVAREALGRFRADVKRLDSAARFEFIDNIESGKPQSAPALQPLADALRAALDQARAEVQALGTGKLEHFIQDYFPHIWEDPAKARSVISRIMGKRPLQGPKSFLKRRTIDSLADGIEAGLVPVTDDPIDLVLLKLREMRRYVMGQRILQDLRANGLVKFVRAGKAAPAGYRRIDDSIATVYGRFTEEGAMTIRGQYFAPEPVATILNNYLSGGLRGNPIFDAYMFVGNALNGVQLGLSLFHLGFVSADAIVSQMALGLEQLAAGQVPRGVANIATQWTAPFTTLVRGNKVIREYLRPGTVGGDFGAIADAVTAGGGRIRMDKFYKNSSIEALIAAARKGRMGRAALHVLPAAIEFAAKPLMEFFVPRMKLGVFADLARFELSKLPKDATRDQVQAVMAKAWDSVDNRMGQLVYDNLFWQKTLKDVGMASVRALGWNLGSARELGGGVYDLGHRRFTHRGAYVIALPIAVGMLGAIIMYLYTGHGPEQTQDYFEPRTGKKDADGNEERVQLPTYMKDVLSFARHPFQTVGHKLHPLLSYLSDMLQNRDYWGDQIRNEHDPLVEQLKQAADYTLTQFTPIGIRNVQEQRRRLQTGERALLPFIGVTPANREAVRSPAQNLMAEYLRERGVGGATPQEKAERQVRVDLVDQYRRGELSYSQVRDRLAASGFTTPQIRDALRKMLEPPLVTRFKQLTLEQAEAVYAKGSPEEKDLWGPILFRKQMGGRTRRPGAPRPPRAPHR